MTKIGIKHKLIAGGIAVFIAISSSIVISEYNAMKKITEEMAVAIESLDIATIRRLDSQWVELTSFRYDNGKDRNLYLPLKERLLDYQVIADAEALSKKRVGDIVNYLSDSSQKNTLSYKEVTKFSEYLGVDYFVKASREYREVSYDKTVLSSLETEMLSQDRSTKKLQVEAFELLAKEYSKKVAETHIERFTGPVLGRIKIRSQYNPNEMGAIVKINGAMVLISYTPINQYSAQSIARAGADTDAEYFDNLQKITQSILESPQVNYHPRNLAIKSTGEVVETSKREYEVYSYCTKFNERDCQEFKTADGRSYNKEPRDSINARVRAEIFTKLASNSEQ